MSGLRVERTADRERKGYYQSGASLPPSLIHQTPHTTDTDHIAGEAESLHKFKPKKSYKAASLEDVHKHPSFIHKEGITRHKEHPKAPPSN